MRGGARLHERQQQREAQHRDDVVERDVPQRAARRRALGLELGGDQQHDGGRGRDADRRGNGGLQRGHVEVAQQREHRREGQHALGDTRGQEPAIVPRPFEVEAPAELEDDEAERDVGEDARVVEGILGEPAKNARPQDEPGDDVPGDRGQHARRRRHAAAEQAGEQQQAEQREAVGSGRPGGKEIRAHRTDHATRRQCMSRIARAPCRFTYGNCEGRPSWQDLLAFEAGLPFLRLDQVLARHAEPHRDRCRDEHRRVDAEQMPMVSASAK